MMEQVLAWIVVAGIIGFYIFFLGFMIVHRGKRSNGHGDGPGSADVG